MSPVTLLNPNSFSASFPGARVINATANLNTSFLAPSLTVFPFADTSGSQSGLQGNALGLASTVSPTDGMLSQFTTTLNQLVQAVGQLQQALGQLTGASSQSGVVQQPNSLPGNPIGGGPGLIDIVNSLQPAATSNPIDNQLNSLGLIGANPLTGMPNGSAIGGIDPLTGQPVVPGAAIGGAGLGFPSNNFVGAANQPGQVFPGAQPGLIGGAAPLTPINADFSINNLNAVNRLDIAMQGQTSGALIDSDVMSINHRFGNDLLAGGIQNFGANYWNSVRKAFNEVMGIPVTTQYDARQLSPQQLQQALDRITSGQVDPNQVGIRDAKVALEFARDFGPQNAHKVALQAFMVSLDRFANRSEQDPNSFSNKYASLIANAPPPEAGVAFERAGGFGEEQHIQGLQNVSGLSRSAIAVFTNWNHAKIMLGSATNDEIFALAGSSGNPLTANALTEANKLVYAYALSDGDAANGNANRDLFEITLDQLMGVGPGFSDASLAMGIQQNARNFGLSSATIFQGVDQVINSKLVGTAAAFARNVGQVSQSMVSGAIDGQIAGLQDAANNIGQVMSSGLFSALGSSLCPWISSSGAAALKVSPDTASLLPSNHPSEALAFV